MKYTYNLGDKVKCNGFLKKTGNFIQIEKDPLKGEYIWTNDTQYPIDFEEGSLVEIKKFEPKEFFGFICGRKSIATHICYLIKEIGYKEVPYISKEKYIDCYEVCVENKNKSWGKRLVPVKEVLSYD